MLMEGIQNYYEKLVTEALAKKNETEKLEAGLLQDVMCVALNHLPPKYIRHDVDMLFYTSPAERVELEEKAKQAVEFAVDYVGKNQRES